MELRFDNEKTNPCLSMQVLVFMKYLYIIVIAAYHVHTSIVLCTGEFVLNPKKIGTISLPFPFS